MFYYNDPLTGGDVEVTDVSSAFYALKICNDDYYGVYYQGQEMLKELSRTGSEVFEQKYALIEPYLPQDTDSSTSSIFTPKIIPSPLPATVPQSVVDAMNYLDEQYAIEEQRLQAELAENTAELKDTISKLENKVAAWFKSEIAKRADWLGGQRSIVLSGCTLRYSGGNVTFSYKELNYD